MKENKVEEVGEEKEGIKERGISLFYIKKGMRWEASANL